MTMLNNMLGLSLASMALVYGVMLLGIYVTASHQGLSCPNWPLCPSAFSFPSQKYFFEDVHRLIAVITASVIFITAFYSVKKTKSVTKTSVVACIIISLQILLGFFVVNTKLDSLLVATHLSTGVLLFSMTLITFLSSYRLARADRDFCI